MSRPGARSPDYPWTRTEDEWRRQLADVRTRWGARDYLEDLAREWAPEVSDQADFVDWFVRHMRRSLSPGAALTSFRTAMELDVRYVLAAVRVPALVDGPARAVLAAAALREPLRAIGIDVRAGLHTGECEVSDGKVVGIAVSIGARISSLAGPGEILVSSTVKDLVAGSGLRFEDRSEHQLKGIREAWHLFALAN